MKKKGIKGLFRLGGGGSVKGSVRGEEKLEVKHDLISDSSIVRKEENVEERQHQQQEQQQQQDQQERDNEETIPTRRRNSERRRNRPADPFHIQELEEADKRFLRGEYDDAIGLYLSAIPLAQEILSPYDTTVGDIFVKIATILQGKGELEAAIDHLVKAKKLYEKSSSMISDNDRKKKVLLGQKLVEVLTGIANLYVDSEEMEKASSSYKKVINACEQHCPNDTLMMSVSLNTYANYLSMCEDKHDEALEILKGALKKALKATNENMTVDCAPTLNNMGRIYMRRVNPANYAEAKEDAKRAEACFNRALQLYRMSLVKNASERLTDTIYHLRQAKELQAGKRGILRNVRFEPRPIERQYTVKSYATYGSDEESSMASSHSASSSAVITTTSETTMGLGFLSMFQCGEDTALSKEFESDDASDTSQNLKENAPERSKLVEAANSIEAVDS